MIAPSEPPNGGLTTDPRAAKILWNDPKAEVALRRLIDRILAEKRIPDERRVSAPR